MSAILKVFPDHMIKDKTTWWLILDCQHWYHWTGKDAPTADADLPCPNCRPPIAVVAEHMTPSKG